MTHLKLVSDEPTPLEKLLLDASRAEQPSNEHKARLRAALGLTVPLAAPPMAELAPSVAPPAGSLPAAGQALSIGKVAASVGALAVVVGALVLARENGGPQASVTSVTPPPVVVTPKVEPLAAAAEGAVSPAPSTLEPAAQVPRRASSRSSAPSVPSEDLAEQIRLVEAARSAIASRDSKSALDALDRYSAKYPRGAFGQEALVLRIRALDQSGESARASVLAKSFVARFPQSPHVARLKPIADRVTSR